MAVSSISSSAVGTLSSPGVGSNLDVNSIVSQLMTVEQKPLNDLQQRQSQLQTSISAYGQVKSALSNLQQSFASLTSASSVNPIQANSSDTTVFSATATSSAVPGTYSVEVSQLANAQKLESAGLSDANAAVGTGTITLEFGTYNAGSNSFTVNASRTAASISINPSNATLAGVRDAINAANAGVTATIVNDGGTNGYHLLLTSSSSGASNSIRLTTSDADGNNTDASGLSQLAYDPTAASGAGRNQTQVVAAQDAALKIDGIAITSASNTVSGAIDGVSLNLAKTNVGSPATLTVARNSSGLQSTLSNFVSAYNTTNATLNKLTLTDTNNSANNGPLSGESTVRLLRTQLRSIITSVVGTSGLTSLSDIGIGFQKDGTLALDSNKLQAAINDPTKNVAALFTALGTPSDSLVRYSSSTASTKAGTYAVNVSQLATQGSAAGSTAASTTITAGVNDTLTLTVDNTPVTVTLAAGSYTADSLAAEIQTKVNGATALSSIGSAVSVSQSGGVLTVTSQRYGSASNVSITGGTAAGALFGTASSTAGVDVAGTIDGVAATGNGRYLGTTSGNASGLRLEITGGTTGSRGSVTFSRGVADRLNTLISNALDTDGAIGARTDGLNATIKNIQSQESDWQDRLTQIEARYRAQFSALDTMIASMNQTSSFLTQQLANLPKTSG